MEIRYHQFAASTLWPSSLPYALVIISSLGSLSASRPATTPTTHFASLVGSASGNATDRVALLSFKSRITSDPSRALASWDEDSLHFCQWHGVTCRDRGHQQRITSLDLNSLNLSGSISPSIANLTFLQALYLSDNQLTGRIPQEIGLLSHLQHLNLSSNSIRGRIPTSLSNCSRLQSVSLDNNDLRGKIPHNLSRCLGLEFISLRSNTLRGDIPSELGSLPHLMVLSLGNNSLTGGIPPSLGNLSSLTQLDLSVNKFTGGIPPPLLENLTSLIFLDLSNNNLTGSIPPSLGNISTLSFIDLSNNQLVGPIPSLEKLSALTVLSLKYNSLTGGIPPSLGNLNALTILSLGYNNLGGVIPSSLWNLSSLIDLSMQNNNLSGVLPWDMGHKLPRLQRLILNINNLSGPIPVSLSNASMLALIQLHINRFSGTIPQSLGALKNLSVLGLHTNQLEARTAADWKFLTALTNCSRLRILEIGGNRLAGMLPNSIGNLSRDLSRLVLGESELSGSIPMEIGNLVNLDALYLGTNLFTGTIPASLGRLQNLELLDLHQNMLSGEIPSTLSNLTLLSRLYLDFNALSGNMPADLANCPLEVLNLAYNKFTGTIPKEVFSIPTLTVYLGSNNILTGPLPLEVGNLRNVYIFNVSENKLSGELPSTLGNCQIMELLYMNGNFFEGSIPSSFSQLGGLQVLDLSRNNLSGNIPKFLASFRYLIFLNLSFNNFEGEVPKIGIFRDVKAFSVQGNIKLCGGVPELNLPPCPKEIFKKKRRSRRLVVIISAASGTLFFMLLLTLFVIRYWINKQGQERLSMTRTKDKLLKVSYAQLLKATEGFSSANLIGVGSFGSVYKGIMEEDDGEPKVVAVKVLNLQQRGASRSFLSECEALRNIRHRNLVKILTSCSSIDFRGNDFKALVFEYMSNGSLDNWLHPGTNEQSEPRVLSLLQRLNIAIDVASALQYLHHHGPTPVIHCDLKPGNILLDNDMVAHVGDFGLARFLTTTVNTSSQKSSSSIALKGSVGYVAPEYGVANKVSTDGDVYSYGMVLLELFTGKRPTDDIFNEGLSLRRYVEMALPEQVADIVDPRLLLEWEGREASEETVNMDARRRKALECVTSALRIGISCSKEPPMERMEMGNVIRELNAARDAFRDIETSRSSNLLAD